MPEATPTQCHATFGDLECLEPRQVLKWCRYHWRQQNAGKAFTAHRTRRPRGSAALRDDQGRKQCARCSEWRPVDDYRPALKSGDGLQSWCSPCSSDYMTLKRYRFDRARVLQIVADQGGCAMCHTAEPRAMGFRNGWHVDHDHKCCPGDESCGLCIRGVLCADCNKLIGLAGDSPERLRQAIAYLRDCEAQHLKDG